jgi:hypothetical protein
MTEKVFIYILSGLIGLGFTLFIYFMKKYFDLIKEYLESLFDPLKDNIQINTKATNELIKRLNTIETTYPQKFVHYEKLEPRCKENERMLFKHDSDIKVIKTHINI